MLYLINANYNHKIADSFIINAASEAEARKKATDCIQKWWSKVWGEFEIEVTTKGDDHYG